MPQYRAVLCERFVGVGSDAVGVITQSNAYIFPIYIVNASCRQTFSVSVQRIVYAYDGRTSTIAYVRAANADFRALEAVCTC